MSTFKEWLSGWVEAFRYVDMAKIKPGEPVAKKWNKLTHEWEDIEGLR